MNSLSAMIQNLKDAGCDDELIAQFSDLNTQSKTHEQLRILACHRQRLIEQLHQNQKRVDCLDYLIYTLRKYHQAHEC